MQVYKSKYTGRQIDEYLDKASKIDETVKELLNSGLTAKYYTKEFTKADFTQVGTEQKYVLAIKKEEHGLNNAYVMKMIINDEPTSCIYEDKTLSTGTVKIYVTIDLANKSQYNGKIYLKGE